MNDDNLIEIFNSLPPPEQCVEHLMSYPVGAKFLREHILAVEFDYRVHSGAYPYHGKTGDELPLPQRIVTGCGIRVREGCFLVANNHPILSEVFADTPWESGIWRYSLIQLNGAEKGAPTDFTLPNGKQVKQKSVKVPISFAKYD